MNKNKRTAPIWVKSLVRKFKIEKDAKNKAYYFILSNGLLDKFIAFDREYKSDDAHKDCIKWLLEHRKQE